MNRVFISDLHLSPDSPVLTQGFFNFLDQYHSDIQELYILGDWFDAWIGDDDDDAWLDTIRESLRQLSDTGVRIYIMHGNRDFLMGTQFAQTCQASLLDEVHILRDQNLVVRLEHGDALCTDDTKYQAFRLMSRNPVWQKGMLAQPIESRRQYAQMARKQSQMNHANRADQIIDVNEEAVTTALTEADILIHGHTHRPAMHERSDGKLRIVLGDWRESSGEGEILLWTDNGFSLEQFHF